MKKYFSVLLMIVNLFFLTACNFLSSDMIHSRLKELTDAKAVNMAQNQMDEIRLAIDSQNHEKIITLFSPAVKDDATVEKGISQLISLFYKQIDDVERLGGAEESSNDYGNAIATYIYDFSITTHKMDYILQISGCTDDYRSSDNIGMTRIVVRPSSMKSNPDEVGDTGIYIYAETE